VLLVLRRYALARVTAAVAVAAILLGWAAAQFPYVLLPDLTIADAAAGEATLVAMLVSLIIGSCLLVPALVYLYRLFQRAERITP
jgi:cytochrome d ubiquinol oxidase subunit II